MCETPVDCENKWMRIKSAADGRGKKTPHARNEAVGNLLTKAEEAEDDHKQAKRLHGASNGRRGGQITARNV